MAIKLPDRQTNPDPANSQGEADDKGDAANSAAVQAQIDTLAASVTEMSKARGDVEAQAKAKADEEAAAQLEAEADLKSLMTGGDEVDETKSKQDKFNDLNNTELVDIIGTSVETAINARIEQGVKQTDEKLKTLTTSIEGLSKILMSMQAKAGIDRARADYPDFDEFKNDTLKVLERYPMMDISDAYVLAKSLRKGQSPSADNLESERPGSPPFGQFDMGDRGKQTTTEATKTKTKTAETAGASGIVGFRDLVNKAAEKIIDARTHQQSR